MVGKLCAPTSLLVSDLQKNADKSLFKIAIHPLEKESKAITCNDSVVSFFDGVDRTKEDSKRRTYWAILGDPGAVNRVGRKGGTKVFKYGRSGKRAPGYRLSTNYFQKFKRMPASDWAQKMLCIIVPNRRTVSIDHEFFS